MKKTRIHFEKEKKISIFWQSKSKTYESHDSNSISANASFLASSAALANARLGAALLLALPSGAAARSTLPLSACRAAAYCASMS